MSEKRL